MRGLLLVAMMVEIGHAEKPAAVGQPLACPNDAEQCELELRGIITWQQRDKMAKWDNVRITRGGKHLYVSINIPHRTRLALKTNQRYRLTVSARKPFTRHDLWIVNAAKY